MKIKNIFYIKTKPQENRPKRERIEDICKHDDKKLISIIKYYYE